MYIQASAYTLNLAFEALGTKNEFGSFYSPDHV